MRRKKEIKAKITILNRLLEIEYNKPNLDQRPFFIQKCESGIKYLIWVIEE